MVVAVPDRTTAMFNIHKGLLVVLVPAVVVLAVLVAVVLQLMQSQPVKALQYQKGCETHLHLQFYPLL